MSFTYLPKYNPTDTSNKAALTPRAREFFASNHKANIAKAIITHSENLTQANNTLWRRQYPLQLRKRILYTYKDYVNNPEMTGIPLSPVTYDANNILDWRSELLVVPSDMSLEDILNGSAPTPAPTHYVKLINANTGAELTKSGNDYTLSAAASAANLPVTVQVWPVGGTAAVAGGGNNYTATGGDAAVAAITGMGATSHTANVNYAGVGTTTWTINSVATYSASVNLVITVTA